MHQLPHVTESLLGAQHPVGSSEGRTWCWPWKMSVSLEVQGKLNDRPEQQWTSAPETRLRKPGRSAGPSTAQYSEKYSKGPWHIYWTNF